MYAKKTINVPNICRTYDAINGDEEDTGFWASHGWEFSIYDAEIREESELHPENYWEPVSPGDLVSGIRDAIAKRCVEHNGSGLFRSVDAEIDYATGREVYYTISFNNMKDTTIARIERAILGDR